MHNYMQVNQILTLTTDLKTSHKGQFFKIEINI